MTGQQQEEGNEEEKTHQAQQHVAADEQRVNGRLPGEEGIQFVKNSQ